MDLSEAGNTARKMSATGVELTPNSVLLRVRGYCHAGTACVVHLPRPEGTKTAVKGAVTSCLHESGLVHAVGVAFERMIDLSGFAAGAAGAERREPAAAAPAAAVLSVLYVDDHEVERRLVERRLGQQGFRVRGAAHRGECLDALREERYDLLLCDLHLDDGSGADLVGLVRSSLHRGPIVYVSSEHDEKTLRGLISLGADAVISKPIDFDALPGLLRSLVSGAVASRGLEIDRREQFVDDETGLFRESLAAQVHGLRRALLKSDATEAIGVCRSIAGSASAFGYAHLSRAADRAIGAIEAAGTAPSGPVENLVAIMDRLAIR
jgi:DNA-binding NarL/FixJ family response regulator